MHTVIVYMRSCWCVLCSIVSGAQVFVVMSCHHWSMSVFWLLLQLMQTACSPRHAHRHVPVVTSTIGCKPCLHGHMKEMARLLAGLIYDSMLMKDVDEWREVDGVCDALKHVPPGPWVNASIWTHTHIIHVNWKKEERVLDWENMTMFAD